MLIATTPIDLGIIKVKKSVTFNMDITNGGSQIIKIVQVRVGCGSCTTATISKNYINPGEVVPLTAVFTPVTEGNNSKTITLVYKQESETTQRELTITFKSTVEC